MKKFLLILMIAIVISAAGCESERVNMPQIPPEPENATIEINAETDAGAESENTVSDNSGAEQDDFSGSDTRYRLDDYMESVREQSDIIKTSLKHDALTQTDMNIKSQELYEIWDDALNYLWDELKKSLPEEEFDKLLEEQLIWIAEKEKSAEDAGKEFEGGSLHPLIVNTEAARITEERVNELYKLLKEAEMQ